MKFSFLLPLVPLVMLAGCASPPPPPPPPPAAPVVVAPPPAPASQCNAAGAQFAVGQQTSPQLEVAAAHRAGAQLARSLRPGQAITMEFNSSRLNLDLNAQGRVTGVRCG